MSDDKLEEILKSVNEGYNIPAKEVKLLIDNFELNINEVKTNLELANNLIYRLQKDAQDLDKAKKILNDLCYTIGWGQLHTNTENVFWPLYNLANKAAMLLGLKPNDK